MKIVFVGFVFLALFFALFFFFKPKGDKLASRLISILLILFGYSIFYSLISWDKMFARFFGKGIIHLDFTIYLAFSLLGPVFYLYLQRVLKNKKLQTKDVLHLLPLLLVSFSLIRYFVLPIESKISVRRSETLSEYIWFCDYLEIFVMLVVLIYAIRTIFTAFRQKVENRDIQIWTRAISFSFIGLGISYCIYTALSSLEILTLKQDYIITLMMALCVGLIGYFAFALPDIFNGKPINRIIPFVKYKKSGLSKEYSAELKNKLIDLVENQQIYLNNEIGLYDLSKSLNISRNHTSQVINEHFKMSFYDFLNSYRVKQAIKYMIEEERLSCNEIAYSVGFNNRISFYKAFKKFTGKSPSEYRQSIPSNNLKTL